MRAHLGLHRTASASEPAPEMLEAVLLASPNAAAVKSAACLEESDNRPEYGEPNSGHDEDHSQHRITPRCKVPKYQSGHSFQLAFRRLGKPNDGAAPVQPAPAGPSNALLTFDSHL